MIAKLTRPSIARAAILPVAGVLAVMSGLAVVALVKHNAASTAASLLEKAALTARIIAPNAAAAVWRFDTQSGAVVLQSLASDPDFEAGIIVDDRGEIFAKVGNSAVATAAIKSRTTAALFGAVESRGGKVAPLHEIVGDDEVVNVLPLVMEANVGRNIGYMALSFSRQRANAAALSEIFAIAAGGFLALVAVCAILAWILSRVTRPIRDMTKAMGRLSAGEFDTAIPALDRCDEIGAMARALAVFKENSIERQRLEFLTSSLQQTTLDLRLETEKVAHLADHDTMTGLANRASFTRQLNRAFCAAQRSGIPFAVLCLDLDHFKDVNDTLGHPQGDILLQAAAKRLARVVRENDVIGRLGGDEFAVLAMDARDHQSISVLAQRINETLAVPFAIESNQLHVSASIGISIFGSSFAVADEMMIQADLALYRTKEGGRNGFCFYSLDLDSKVRERATIARDLQSALDRNELELYYQPQVEISSGRITGLEALVRWNHPTRGLLTSAAFVAIAEVTGMIVPLGHWILEESCRRFRRWNRQGLALPLLTINFSAAQFKASPNLDRELEEILNRYEVEPRSIEIEVTERTLMEITETHGLIIERIRALGVGIAIDDFGTGYSSLARLQHAGVSRLKIAKQFMRAPAANPADAAIVRATIGLARELGIDVAALGVETADSLGLLVAAGCESAQGDYFCLPVTADAAADLLRRGVLLPHPDVPAVAAPTLAPDHIDGMVSGHGPHQDLALRAS